MADTSKAAVERLAAHYDERVQQHVRVVEMMPNLRSERAKEFYHFHTETAATLRALLIERDAAQVEVARLTAALAEAETRGWQPISTAPKDGRLVLIRTAHGDEWAETFTAHWSELAQGWFYAQDRTVPRPTHWLPLPLPPRERDGQEG